VRKLLGYIAYRVDPEKRTHELGRLLASSHVDTNFEQDLIDYTFGLDGTLGESPDFSEQEDTPEKVHTKETKWRQQKFRELRAFALADEMTDWILTFQLSGDAGWTHAIQRWQKQRTLPWLVAAISIINADDKVAPELLLAAEQVPSSSPAYPTISYHRVRLLMQAGKGEQARALLNELLPSLQDKVSASSYNLFLAQRAKLVTSFQDFLIYASRPSVGEDSWGDEVGDDWLDCGWRDPCEKLVFGKTIRKPMEPRFDTETALILNTRIPLDLLGQAAIGGELAEKLRGELAVAAWTRAVMLGRHDIASTMAPEAAKAYPVMKDDLESYISAGTAQDKWHAALFTILGYPGARPYVNALSARSTPMQKIDNYSDNWWCEDLGSNPGEVNYVKDADSEVRLKQRRDAPGYPAFLSAEQVSAAKSEWKALSASGSANGYLSQQALKWAKEAPDDPRIPEVLHDAVRATRFACGRKSTSDVSREAFRLLHSRYPHSRWAKETPYWY
jgi:hypothetical protein